MAGASSLIPLILLFVVVGVVGFVGYHMYVWSGELADRGRAKLEKKHMAFTKDGGLRVGVKEIKEENYADKTQSVLVNVWNHAALPNYKSRLGWNSTQTGEGKKSGGSSSSAHSTSSRHASAATSSSAATTSSGGGRSLVPPATRPQRRSASPVPGGWD